MATLTKKTATKVVSSTLIAVLLYANTVAYAIISAFAYSLVKS